MNRSDTNNRIVLVGVLKESRDLDILLREHWYRIPVAHASARPYAYLAFYQPAVFARQGKRIQYYARVLGYRTVRRDRLLPDESDHPRARDSYLKVRVGKIQRLPRPIRNIIPRRVTFGFTTLYRLRTVRDLLQLYDITPIEQMVGDALRRVHITALPEYTVTGNGKRYRLDFAVWCARGKIAIECDNKASHTSPEARKKDKQKELFLRRRGWTVMRLREQDIVLDAHGCVARVQKAMRKLGGLSSAEQQYSSHEKVVY